MLQLTPLGREFLALPDAAQLGFVFAAWWEGVDWGDRPGPPGHAGRHRHPGPHVPLAGLVRPHRHHPALLAAAAAMPGPEPPAVLAAATAN